MPIPSYTQSQLDKLLLLGEKALAIVAFQDNAPEESTDRFFDDTYNKNLNYTLQKMPKGYSQGLAWLIKQYSTREGDI